MEPYSPWNGFNRIRTRMQTLKVLSVYDKVGYKKLQRESGVSSRIFPKIFNELVARQLVRKRDQDKLYEITLEGRSELEELERQYNNADFSKYRNMLTERISYPVRERVDLKDGQNISIVLKAKGKDVVNGPMQDQLKEQITRYGTQLYQQIDTLQKEILRDIPKDLLWSEVRISINDYTPRDKNGKAIFIVWNVDDT